MPQIWQASNTMPIFAKQKTRKSEKKQKYPKKYKKVEKTQL